MDMHIAPAKVREIASEFGSSKPYGYAAASELFDATTVLRIAREVEANLAGCPREENIHASYRKHRLSVIEEVPEYAHAFVASLNAPPFLRALSGITGIESLNPGPELHVQPSGGGHPLRQIGNDEFRRASRREIRSRQGPQAAAPAAAAGETLRAFAEMESRGLRARPPIPPWVRHA
ncbi:MAG: hypothetical protein KGK35_02715 [Xanthomonadaceae bacterium]|nr:hypothetical protein [Xanthomonadaceae bacterium]